MAFGRRPTTDNDRVGRSVSGVGLLSSRRRRNAVSGRICGHCGAEAQVDMVDMARARAYLTCRTCGNEWDTDRLEVVRSA